MTAISPSLEARVALLTQQAAPARRPVVCDVGANPAYVPAYDALRKLGACTVVGFEPQDAAYDQLIDAAQDNETYIKAALGKPGKAVLNVYRSGGFTSIFKLRKACLDWLGKLQGQLHHVREVDVTLQAMDKIKEIPQVDLLKIDVQGSELAIIGGGRKKLADAVAVITEVRYYKLYEDEPLWGQLEAELEKQGFVLLKLLPYKSHLLPNSQADRMDATRSASQLVDGDAVYIRRMEGLDDLSDDQLKCQALFAGCVYDAQDLAILCLDRLAARGAVKATLPAGYAALLPEEYWKRDAAK
ncbi:MAG: FkbM family methyltransferase [Sulfitobacter sp.]